MIDRGVVVAGRPDLVRAGRHLGLLGDRRGRGLQAGAVEQAGLAGAAIVVGDERVAREQALVERDAGGRAEVERLRRALARAAGDQEHRAARRAEGGHLFDVQRDGARNDAGRVERHVDFGAQHLRTGRAGRGCGVGVSASARDAAVTGPDEVRKHDGTSLGREPRRRNRGRKWLGGCQRRAGGREHDARHHHTERCPPDDHAKTRTSR